MKNMSGVKFFITSKDSKQKPIAFSLRETEEGDWKLTPGSLTLAIRNRGELSNAIVERQMKS